ALAESDDRALDVTFELLTMIAIIAGDTGEVNEPGSPADGSSWPAAALALAAADVLLAHCFKSLAEVPAASCTRFSRFACDVFERALEGAEATAAILLELADERQRET